MKKCKVVPDLKCVRTNYFRFAGSTFNIYNDSSEAAKKLQKKCKCLPDCLLNNYPSEISTGALYREYSFNSLSFFKDINLTDQTLIHIFFNDLISTHYRKDMYQNWLGVLAAFGGISYLFSLIFFSLKFLTSFFISEKAYSDCFLGFPWSRVLSWSTFSP